MKKILFGLLVIVLLALTLAYFYLPGFVYLKITDYEPFTFERVLGDTAWIAEYEIGDHQGPKDYGYDQVEEITFKSAVDGLPLSAWYVKSSRETDSTIFMIHGRTSNRLKTMKYLELFKDKGLDTLYNVFIADMRNSGKSPATKTYMGYSFAEDIAGGLQYLSQDKQQKHFVLYSFSMGAIATCTFLGRDELGADQYDIQKVILDSPLTDVPRILRENAQKLGLPDFIIDNTYEIFEEDTKGFADNMKMGTLLADQKIPFFVIQSNHDQTTPASHTKDQVSRLDPQLIKTWYMDSVRHVRVYTNPKYRTAYEEKVNDFLRN